MNWETSFLETAGQELHEVVQTLIRAISSLSEQICGLRTDVGELRSDMRSVREQNARQDQEIWGADGASRYSALQGDAQKQALQIKGLWAILGALIGFAVSLVLAHLS